MMVKSKITILPSASRTGNQNSNDFEGTFTLGVVACLDMTDVSASPSVTMTIQGKDDVSGQYYDIISTAAITTAGLNVLKVYPSITAVTNESAADILPYTWRVVVTANNANAATYSVGVSTIE